MQLDEISVADHVESSKNGARVAESSYIFWGRLRLLSTGNAAEGRAKLYEDEHESNAGSR